VTVPSPIIAEATSPSGATVTFSASATDDIDGSIIPICNPTSGSTFALGITTVTCTATDNTGNRNSAIFTVTVRDTTPPTVPYGLTATAISTSIIDLSWAASYDAVGTIRYIIYRSLDGVNFASIGTTTATNFQNIGLMPNTIYYYRIGARDTANNPSINSSIASATTFVLPPPTPTPSPTGTPNPTPTPTPTPIPDYPPILTLPSDMILEATSSSGTVATFSVSAYDNEDGESKTVTCVPSSGSIFSLGTTYVTCTAADNIGNIGSGVFAITVQDTTSPTAPSGLTATAISTSRIDLSWVASTDIVGIRNYRIYRSLDNINWRSIGTRTGTSFSDIGLIPNTTYYYRVEAYDTSNNPSTFSNVANAKTFELSPSPPPTPTPTTPIPTSTPTETGTPTPTPTSTVNPCAPPESGNTPQGQNVEVPVASTIGVTFDTVLQCGDTTAVAYYYNEWTSLPSSYEKVLFYDIDTSATYDNTITIKVTYPNSDIPSGVSEQTLRLFHYENGNWVDVTTALDTISNVITGRVNSLSPFGIGGITGSGGGGGGNGVMRGSSFDNIGLITLIISLIIISIFTLKRKIDIKKGGDN
jgi:chitodextrinase